MSPQGWELKLTYKLVQHSVWPSFCLLICLSDCQYICLFVFLSPFMVNWFVPMDSFFFLRNYIYEYYATGEGIRHFIYLSKTETHYERIVCLVIYASYEPIANYQKKIFRTYLYTFVKYNFRSMSMTIKNYHKQLCF